MCLIGAIGAQSVSSKIIQHLHFRARLKKKKGDSYCAFRLSIFDRPIWQPFKLAYIKFFYNHWLRAMSVLLVYTLNL